MKEYGLVKTNKIYLNLIIIYYIIFASLFVFINPVFEAPDEDLHIQYINYVSVYKNLPDQYEGQIFKEKFVGQGHQHPFYYIFTGTVNALFNPDNKLIVNSAPNNLLYSENNKITRYPHYNHIIDNEFPERTDKYFFYFFRFLSVFFGALNLYFIYKISQFVFPDSAWSLFPVLFVATLPQFLFISSAVNNDNLANLLSAVCIFFLFKIVNDNFYCRNYLYLGIFIGIGILTKKTLLFLVPVVILLFIWIILRNRKSKTALLKYFSYTFIITLLLSSALFIRNYMVYGEFLGSQMEINTMPQFVEKKSLFSYYFINPFAKELFHSFVGVFGWMNVFLPDIFYKVYIFIFILAVGGVVLFIKNNNDRKPYFYLSSVVILSCLAGVVYFNLIFTQYQGRYMFPALSAIALVFAIGLFSLLVQIKVNLIKQIFISLFILFVVLIDVFSLFVNYDFYYEVSKYL